jgi:hypothetical protein
LGKKWDDDKEQWVEDESHDAATAAIAAKAAKAAKRQEQERQANQVPLASSRVGAGSIVRYKPEFFKKHRVLTSNSRCPRGRPPKGMEWDDDQGKWAKQEKQARKRAYPHTARFGDSGKKLLGFWVCKMFVGNVFEGTIRSFRVDNGDDLYTIEYEDGNKEDLALEKMVEAHNKATSANNSKTNGLKSSNCRPRGRPPKGKTWDVDTAQWVGEEGSASASASSSAAPSPKKKAKLTGGSSRQWVGASAIRRHQPGAARCCTCSPATQQEKHRSSSSRSKSSSTNSTQHQQQLLPGGRADVTDKH